MMRETTRSPRPSYEAVRKVAARSFAALLQQQLTIATAESCTAGLVSALLTEFAGSSQVVVGGVCAYAPQVKEQLLGVPSALLTKHGVVSREVALAMAAGVRERLHATIGLATTGIAGPGGGSAATPVGTVWCALVSAQASKAFCLQIPGDRAAVRFGSAEKVLEELCQFIIIDP